MNAKYFKKSYVRWSYAVALCIPTFIFGLVLCDQLLGYDFSRNMYLMSFICCGAVLSLLSLTWISILNSRMFKEWLTGEPSQDNRKVDLSDIEQCVRKEGFIPVRIENRVTFKVSGEPVDVVYEDEKLSLIRTYRLDEDINLDILYKACSMLHDSIFLVRSSLHRYDDNQMGLVFEVQSLVKTPAELERYFGTYLQFLYHGIACHRECYCKLLEEAAAQTKEANLTRDNDTKILS
jgi:hypothetical protein